METEDAHLTQASIDLPWYPVSPSEISTKVAKKKGRRKRPEYDAHQPMEVVRKIVNPFGEKIVQVDGEIPVELTVNDSDRFLFISYDQSHLTHGLHKYPAKFFPELPRWLIKRYSQENDMILDPFSGSGTTNVEALLLKRNSVGIDVDPFSRFISTVKVTPLAEKELIEAQESLFNAVEDYQPTLVSESDIPAFPYRDNWFNREITLELAYLKKSIESLDKSERVKDFFKVCFSSIIRSVSNADDNCTRTVIRKVLKKQVNPSDALRKFVEAVLVKVPKMIEFSQNVPQDITVSFPENMDARNIEYPPEDFDLVLTSPPYANAVDYPRTHQLELYWLGFADGTLTPLNTIVKATQLSPQYPNAYGFLGLTYDLLGNRPLADEHFQQALQLDPNNSVFRRYLEQRDRRDIPILQQLSEKADYLLNQAAADPERKIEHFDLEQGIIISTNGEDIIREYMHRRNMPQDRRETVEAEWGSALRELISAGYLEQSGGQQPLTLFRVTEAGCQHVSQSNPHS